MSIKKWENLGILGFALEIADWRLEDCEFDHYSFPYRTPPILSF
jgi:hypothetical protein